MTLGTVILFMPSLLSEKEEHVIKNKGPAAPSPLLLQSRWPLISNSLSFVSPLPMST